SSDSLTHPLSFHAALPISFAPDPARLTRALHESGAEVAFNLVESVFSQGDLAGISAAMLARLRIPFTGASAAVPASLRRCRRDHIGREDVRNSSQVAI